MRLISRYMVRWGLAGLLLCGIAGIVESQTSKGFPGPKSSRKSSRVKKNESKTTVIVEILTGKAGAGLQTQQWRPFFEQLGVAVRIRQSILNEEPEVVERKFGRLRQITLRGRLDRRGKLVFLDRTFVRGDAAKFREWIRELETYGAQGAPEGKPLWGLNKTQYGGVHTALSRKTGNEIEGLALEAALEKLELPSDYPLRLTTTTRSWLATRFPGAPKTRKRLLGTSQGTALAILLDEYGLGFRPLRTPEGSIELVIDPLEKTTDAWPIGWDLRKLKLSRQKTAPKLFALIPVELDNVKFLDILNAVSIETEVPIHVDHYRIEARGTDLEKLRVSHPPRKSSWSLLLRRVTNPHKLMSCIRVDELGQPLVWITTLQIGSSTR